MVGASSITKSEATVRRVGAGLLVVALVLAMSVLVAAAPGHAASGVRPGHVTRARVVVNFGVGPFWWPYPYWYYPPPPYYVYSPPPVIVQEPPVYIQQPPPPPPAPELPPTPQAYWYYCPSARGYYPSVPTCAEAWIRVPPRPE